MGQNNNSRIRIPRYINEEANKFVLATIFYIIDRCREKLWNKLQKGSQQLTRPYQPSSRLLWARRSLANRSLRLHILILCNWFAKQRLECDKNWVHIVYLNSRNLLIIVSTIPGLLVLLQIFFLIFLYPASMNNTAHR